MRIWTHLFNRTILIQTLITTLKDPLHVLTDANLLVLIDADQSICVNVRFSLPSDIHRLIIEHRKFSGNSFNFGNFRFLKKLPVFFNFLNILPSFSKMYEWICLVFIGSLCIFVDILTVCYTFIHFL